ncbi:Glyoxalase family protein [Marinobacterium lacunae]|uniref:Glyoxalase family protein n=1 Tax=Marinobacterium lacunae TaxID=1232683 RepID=A0A081FXC2_9GAMM|nr:VOC family protein [Marinobacterium lacunae]KEA63177.1 Glyoxalase family protein [Marinobacterium lacunae]
MSAMTKGVHHLGLTVSDLAETERFFCDALGFERVGEKPDYPAVFIHDGTVMLTLWQVQAENAVSFDRKSNLGLHHFALAVDGVTGLEKAYERLQNFDGVEIEFAPEPLGDTPIRHMMCTIPGGIRMELIATGGN